MFIRIDSNIKMIFYSASLGIMSSTRLFGMMLGGLFLAAHFLWLNSAGPNEISG